MDMVTKKIALLPGDGIGPEVCRQAVKVLDAVAERFGHRFEFTSHLVGACAIGRHRQPVARRNPSRLPRLRRGAVRRHRRPQV